MGTLEAIGAGLAAAGALAVWIWRALRKAKAQERERRAGQDARDYRETRKEIDNADLGHGATDQQRIDRLREIAGRRGGDRKD